MRKFMINAPTLAAIDAALIASSYMTSEAVAEVEQNVDIPIPGTLNSQGVAPTENFDFLASDLHGFNLPRAFPRTIEYDWAGLTGSVDLDFVLLDTLTNRIDYQQNNRIQLLDYEVQVQTQGGDPLGPVFRDTVIDNGGTRISTAEGVRFFDFERGEGWPLVNIKATYDANGNQLTASQAIPNVSTLLQLFGQAEIDDTIADPVDDTFWETSVLAKDFKTNGTPKTYSRTAQQTDWGEAYSIDYYQKGGINLFDPNGTARTNPGATQDIQRLMSELEDLIDDLATYSRDPLGFVLWAFPWGEEFGELEKSNGPEEWQAEVLKLLGEGLITVDEAIRIAVTSGHGVGKSALVAWVIIWAISTCVDTRGVVTANTENQLKTKTWVELATWYRRFIGRELFKLTATSFFSADPEHERTWRIDMVPWSERNTEAFAGLHNKNKRILLVMDEASAVPDLIWEVAEGALTDEDTEIIWLATGNPTRNKGRFRDCHPGGKFAHRWKNLKVDSRIVSFTNKEQINAWIEDYGVDSDFVRVRILGEFPRIDSDSFISYEIALAAVGRAIEPQDGEALILGVDVGRFGNDPSVIYPRRGRDGASYNISILHGYDTIAVAAEVVKVYNALRADAVMVDGGGVGGGVVDRLRQLRLPVFDISFAGKANYNNEIEPQIKYANKRAEMWGAVRDWLTTGSINNLTVPSPSGTSLTLVDELIGPTYGLNMREEILLEAKKDMVRRGTPSPNVADALALTFAYPAIVTRAPSIPLEATAPANTYDPFAHERIYAR